MNRTRRKLLLAVIASTVGATALCFGHVRRLFHPLVTRLRGRQTVEQRLAEFSAARQRLQAQFDPAGVAYPPARVLLLGLKSEQQLAVFAGPATGVLTLIASHPVREASGALGPKRAEGDRQVPEGVYALESLNPNSRFHVALRVGYPNAFDRAMAERDGRADLGGDIMIHGGSASVGCLAMGDDVAEELFVLAAEAGIDQVTIVLAPLDLRHQPLPAELNTGWQRELYASLREAMQSLP